MVEMHECAPGKRFDRYHELGQHAFGEKLGLWIVVPQQLIVEISTDIVYMVTGGKSLMKFHDTVWPNRKGFKETYFIIIFGSAHFALSQLPNFNSITAVSLIAAVMSLTYENSSYISIIYIIFISDIQMVKLNNISINHMVGPLRQITKNSW
jgi:Transmembrane amino acid transporter protein